MRRQLIAPLIVVALVLALGLVLAGCGTAPQNAGAGDDQTPAGILAASMEATSNITSAKANFDLSVSFDLDKTKVPADELSFVGQPMQVSGQLTFASQTRALDLTVDASLSGKAMNFGAKLVGDKLFLSVAGKWYEAPAEMMQTLGGSTSQTTTTIDVQKMLTDAGINPATWMKNVTMVGEETLDGVAVYHLEAAPDLTAIANDVFKLLQSGQFSGMMGQTNAAAGTNGGLPGLQSLDGLETQLPEMFRNLKADLWVAEDGLTVMKASLGAQIVPPAGQDSGGINAINLSLTLAMKDVNQPVSVVAPASAESWDALQKALQADPSLLGPLGTLGGAALGGAGLDGTATAPVSNQ